MPGVFAGKAAYNAGAPGVRRLPARRRRFLWSGFAAFMKSVPGRGLGLVVINFLVGFPFCPAVGRAWDQAGTVRGGTGISKIIVLVNNSLIFIVRNLWMFRKMSPDGFFVVHVYPSFLSVCAGDTEKTQEYHRFSIQRPQI